MSDFLSGLALGLAVANLVWIFWSARLSRVSGKGDDK